MGCDYQRFGGLHVFPDRGGGADDRGAGKGQSKRSYNHRRSRLQLDTGHRAGFVGGGLVRTGARVECDVGGRCGGWLGPCGRTIVGCNSCFIAGRGWSDVTGGGGSGVGRKDGLGIARIGGGWVDWEVGRRVGGGMGRRMLAKRIAVFVGRRGAGGCCPLPDGEVKGSIISRGVVEGESRLSEGSVERGGHWRTCVTTA